MLDAILAGASGYVVKDIRGMELAQAIKAVGSGKSLLDNRAAAVLMSRLRRDTQQDERLRDLSSYRTDPAPAVGRRPDQP